VKKLFLIPIVLLSASVAAIASKADRDFSNGSWNARLRSSNRIYLQINSIGSMDGDNYAMNELQGLPAEPEGNVEFQLQREPGTFSFSGTFSKSNGGGVYNFQPNPAFVKTMSSLGYDLSPEDVFDMTLANFRSSFIHEWAALGYRSLTAGQVRKMTEEEITPDYIRQLQSRGYKSVSWETLYKMRTEDVTPEFIDSLAKEGYKGLAPEQLLELSASDLTAEKIEEYKKVGYPNLPLSDLRKMADNDIDSDYIVSMKKAGLSNLSVNQLLKLMNNDVDSHFVREAMQKNPNATVEQIVRMRNDEDD